MKIVYILILYIMIPNLYLLNTYGMNNPDEGLAVVYHSIKNLGIEIRDSKQLENKKIFVAGMADARYIPFLNKKNFNIIYTTYEFCPIPHLWVHTLNIWYSLIIVPHAEIRKMFIDSGVQRPIFVVQQGFPLRTYIPLSPSPPHFIESSHLQKFTIGFLGVPVKRKNLELLIPVIEELKMILPQIVLKVHISKYYKEMTPIKFPENDHFVISYGYKNDQEINEWYSSLDCYIFPSSGEGWSFTPRESLSLGIPTIASDCLVHRDLTEYCNMIQLPITQDNISAAIKETFDSYANYQKKALEGKSYVTTYNRNEDMLNTLRHIIQ